MASQSPLINGKNYDWGNLTVVAFGIPFIGITEVEYSRDRESTNNYGFGNEPVSFGNGNFVYEASLTLYVDELRAITNQAPNKSILEIPPFSVIVLCAGPGIVPFTDTLKNCRFLKDPFASKQNDKMITVKVPMAWAGITKA